MSNQSVVRPIIAYCIVLSLAVFLFLAGAGLGVVFYRRFHDQLPRLIADQQSIISLADILRIGQRKNLNAYKDPRAAQRLASEINWQPGYAMAPFIGASPAIGTHGTSSINSRQFRYDKEIAPTPPARTLRIFLIGGSTAFGVGALSNQATIGGLLERDLNERRFSSRYDRAQVITAAAPAWATTQEFLEVWTRINDLHPDLVVSFSGFNDCAWAFLGQNILWFRTFADTYLFTIVDLAYDLAGVSREKDVVPTFKPPPTIAESAIRTRNNVELIAHILGTVGAKYVFTMQPSAYWTRKPLTEDERAGLPPYAANAREYYAACKPETMKQLAKISEPNFLLIDSSGIFDSFPGGEDVFLDQVHFGDKGNEQIANYLSVNIRPILARLSKNGDR